MPKATSRTPQQLYLADGEEERDIDWSGVSDAIRRYALARLHHRPQAEDIAQETILRCVEYCREQKVASFYALAYRIADNLIVDHHRMGQRNGGELRDDMVSDLPLPDQIVADRLEVERLAAAIRSLPPLRREVFLRRRLLGQSSTIIASELQLTSKAIEKHISRALEVLTKAMKRPASGGRGIS